jgi:hypothetical protein
MDGRGARRRADLSAADPISMLTALGWRFSAPSVIVERGQISHGSRAIVLTRRVGGDPAAGGAGATVHREGPALAVRSLLLPGQGGHRMVMPHDADDRFLPGLNLQQQYIEQFLIEAIETSPLIELRWQTAFTGLAQDGERVTVQLDTPAGPYELQADWCVAADGGRSSVRRVMGLRLEGDAYRGNFVIADILAPIDLPTERLCYFDPEWNRGNNVLVHRQPDGLWRLDFRLPDDETAEQALQPALLGQRIEAILQMIGQPVAWKLDWATVYSASTKTLAEYRVGRVLFAGDAAHLLPIWRARSNTGGRRQLGWCSRHDQKLGRRQPSTATFGARDRGARTCEGARSTRFMTPPTAGRLMRDATLSPLSGTSGFHAPAASRPRNAASRSLRWMTTTSFTGGCAASRRNVRLTRRLPFDHLRLGFTSCCFPCASGWMRRSAPCWRWGQRQGHAGRQRTDRRAGSVRWPVFRRSGGPAQYWRRRAGGAITAPDLHVRALAGSGCAARSRRDPQRARTRPGLKGRMPGDDPVEAAVRRARRCL